MNHDKDALSAVLATDEGLLVDGWLAEAGLVDPNARRIAHGESSELLHLVREALAQGADPASLQGRGWEPVRAALEALSRARVVRGQSAGDTSLYVLAFKKPLFTQLQQHLAGDAQALATALWSATTLVDRMAQHTVNTFQQAREDVIRRQQEELLELSTPVVKLWDGVLAVPMIGVLDSNRTQVVMETLLQAIVDTDSRIAIMDITGVPTVDTLVAQHLLKTVTAIRLMGAECIISGIRPQIAQTIVHLGIDLQGVQTRATLADALALALQQTGWRMARA